MRVYNCDIAKAKEIIKELNRIGYKTKKLQIKLLAVVLLLLSGNTGKK